MENLLIRYFSGTLSDDEKSILFKHIEQDNALRTEFVRLQNLMAIAGMASHTEDEGVSETLYTLLHRIHRRRIRRICLSVMKYAAMIILLAGVWFISKEYAFNRYTPEYTLIEAFKGQRVYVMLADGTEVWLSSRSQLHIPDQFNKSKRTVKLSGEGLFSVGKNEQKPFIVQTRQHSVTVTGTQFNVFAYAESPLFEVDLMKGAVSVSSNPPGADRLYLSPNEKAYVRDGKLFKTTSSFMQSHYIKNGIYNFENQPMKEIAARLELWYDVKIRIVKPEMENYRFSGKFRQTDNIGQILKAMKETGKFDYHILNDQQIEIY
ncbi:MAG: FecR family protein [Tannerella sp.]|jgi:ferric-dicitrate binding protein FerR (iron transport regulator)|nr:FecR family protein [Tannerella sp.]